jgi:hypothetical protein
MKLRALAYTTEELGLPSGLLPVLCDAILDDMHPAQVPWIEPQATHRDEVVAMGGLRGSQTYTTENCRVCGRCTDRAKTMRAENMDGWHREHWEGGRQEGLQEGRREGIAEVVLRLLRLKLGPLEPEVEERVNSTAADRLLEWGDRILAAESLQDVFRD